VLTTAQVRAFTPLQIAAIDPADITALNSSQMRALTTAQIGALTTAQIDVMETADLVALTPSQILGFTTAQIAVMDAAQIDAVLSTPLALDLDGDGLETLGLAAGVRFDLEVSGQPVPVGWIGPDDGLLAIDLNRNGRIDDGSELFGTHSGLAGSSGVTELADGFAALALLDDNRDARIDASDARFAELLVWVDRQQDGVSQDDELHSLAHLGIVSIQLEAKRVTIASEGNWILLQASYQDIHGRQGLIADVWLQIDRHSVELVGVTQDLPHLLE
jgi:hypothetical protein